MDVSRRDYERVLVLVVELMVGVAMQLEPELKRPAAGPADGLRCPLCRPPREETTERARIRPLLVTAEKRLRHLVRWRESLLALADDPDRQAGLGVTPRELGVLGLLAEGLTASTIARRLGISPRTVSKHQENLYRKLEATNRVTAIRHAQWLGLLPEADPPPL
ncbi:helix-turn-helix transcriptional regulator [Nonomuraea sp. PA05]|uniref:helix-turn-helix transcriptional regulator n=1 Tax=Nonomuraea sp. PA05 TaxID=2604466 RepID=UPI0011D6A064|nr:helix-turn-helix transcriptional regulator [Nonomuraea sp. PA05]TYB58273.1 helix-turn-helix transcriptional regulator [Nonomuraea sp. PA05]